MEMVHTEVLGLAAQVHLINNIDVLKSIRSYIRSASNLTKMDKEMHTPRLLPSNNTEPSVQEKEHICKILLNDNVTLYPER